MGFLSPILLAGIAAVAVPVVLHLVMRRQARQLTFPALRFVQQRRESNRRRMQLRHWLLLALRCLLVAGIAFALARPTIKGTGLRGKEGAPLAVAVVVDNSLRMQYVHQNQTRLEEASDAARNFVGKLPEDAMVAVCDLGRAASGFAPDLNAATSRLKNLRAAPDSRPLATVVVEAIAMVAQHAERRQEVFVFSDMTAPAWPDDGVKAIEAALASAPDVRLYVFDSGVTTPKNASLGELKLRRSILRPGEPLHIETTVASSIGGEAPLVELKLAGEDGRVENRGQHIVEFDPSGQGRVTFEVADLPLGTHQGMISLAASDPLAPDNTRYFTVEVRPPARVLLLADRARDARLLSLALSPELGDRASRFECKAATFDNSANEQFDEYQAVLLLDPGKLPDELWKRLDEYVAGGGGVGIFLGHNADVQAMNAEAPQRLLPGKLERISRDETYLRPKRLDHPALSGLRDYEEDIPWPICKVFRYWQFGLPLGSDSHVAATLANDDPAILERTAGRGRVLTTTTPLAEPLNIEGRDAWNLLAAQEVAWPMVAVCDHLVGYLAQDADERLNYLAGETARVRLSPQQQLSKYVLRMPDGQASSRPAAGGDELAVSVTDELGNYRLTAGGQTEKLDRGFSVNAPPNVSNLTRVDATTLAAALPKERVRLADSLDKVEEYVNIGRSGRELYPWAICLVALVWGAEHVLANRFYRQPISENDKTKN